MAQHFYVGGEICVLIWRRCGDAASLLREGTLAGKYVMQPLCEKPSMERNCPSVGLSNPVQLIFEPSGQYRWFVVKRCNIRYDANDVLRRSKRRVHSTFDLVQDSFAFVYATDEVVLKGYDAI